MKQYEIRWGHFPPPIGRRPVLLLSRTPAYHYLNKVIVVEITGTMRGIPQEVDLGRPEGMAQACVANFDNVHVVPLSMLKGLIGAVSPSREREVKRALGYALGWPELKVL